MLTRRQKNRQEQQEISVQEDDGPRIDPAATLDENGHEDRGVQRGSRDFFQVSVIEKQLWEPMFTRLAALSRYQRRLADVKQFKGKPTLPSLSS